MASPLDLPICSHLAEIERLVSENPVVLLSSPPGTGKTTILPPFLMQSTVLNFARRIALLEPRRIAAVRTAEFITANLNNHDRSPELVGYRVRGESRIGAATKLEVQTYGVFNRIAASSIDLAEYDLVILDEAHERSIDIDLALAQALEIQGSIRPDLKIIIMSATLNVEDLRSVAPQAPLVTVSAQTFPVEVSYLPPSAAEQRQIEQHLVRAVRSIVHRQGDILAFLPGANEITRCVEALSSEFPQRNVVSLYGDLALKEQRAILNPSDEEPPRIIVSSSIAETSLTVPRVHTVIDAGLSRIPRFDQERGIPGLETVRVSSATAEQRTGRAGRLGPGICIRLWAEHEALVRFRSPEIIESDLSALILTLASAGVTDHRSLRWITQPSNGAVTAARELLRTFSAIDPGGRITPHGSIMQALPIHPRLAHMVTVAAENGAAELGCQLAATWSELKPSAQSALLDLNTIPRSNMIGSVRELMRQLLNTANRLIHTKSAQAFNEINPALLFAAAFPDRIGHRRGEREYLLSGGPRAMLPQGSGLVREEWLICPAVRSRTTSVNATISAAAPISEGELRKFFPDLFVKSKVETFNSSRKAVVSRAVETIGAIEISVRESPSDSSSAPEILLANVKFSDLPISERSASLIERARWLHTTGIWSPQSGTWWERLQDDGHKWLVEFIPGVSRLNDIDPEQVYHAIEQIAGGRSEVDRISGLAPSALTLPRGRTVTLRYSEQRAPVVASRLQDFFGVRTHPTVAGGRIAVICELLSPAGRPVQVTDDLPRFWSGSYAEVRKELKSRYPKHDWPENP